MARILDRGSRGCKFGGAMTISQGWIEGAVRKPSPNQDERPPDTEISLVVVHGISLPPGEFGGPWIEALFTNMLPADVHPYFAHLQSVRVSSHLLIRRDGSMVQFVPFEARAWHAGVSSWKGRERCNDFSIGIELEGCDTVPYSSPQYKALERALIELMRAYPGIGPESVVGHSDIAPGRKTDPGPAFDRSRMTCNFPG